MGGILACKRGKTLAFYLMTYVVTGMKTDSEYLLEAAELWANICWKSRIYERISVGFP